MRTDSYKLLLKENKRLIAENSDLQEQIDSLQQKVHLCTAYDKLLAENSAMREAMQEFVDRCEKGFVQSRYTYGLFKGILNSDDTQQRYITTGDVRKSLECKHDWMAISEGIEEMGYECQLCGDLCMEPAFDGDRLNES